jgi:hypothetical protein
MTEPDQLYYRRREQQERDRATRASDAAARRIHLDLAHRYQSLVDGDRSTPAPRI